KLLTGRYRRFDSLRTLGGLSGFTNRGESEYDCFGAGHSSTSLSAGLGFAEADRLSESDAYTVVVLGDGAFTGGMIHEALNNCNAKLGRLIIILNENEMSISKNIGRFATSLSTLRKSARYFKAKRATTSLLKKIPLIGKPLFRLGRGIKKAVKNMLYGSNYFENLGLYYLGPVDGNDYDSVEQLLRVAKSAGENVIVHLKTQKGKGYEPAEQYPDKYHGVSPAAKPAADVNFSKQMGQALCDLASCDERICAITAAMSSGTGLDAFAACHKERFFDVGIAEEHAATFAAGLSANGMKPVFAVYSTFLQRSYDQLIHDVALQNIPVVLCIDRAGFNNADGATHHGIFDVAALSQLPNFRIYTPVSFAGLRASLADAVNQDTPCAIRYPSGCEIESVIKHFYANGHDGKITWRTDFDVANAPKNVIITHGRISAECILAKAELCKEGIDVGIVLCECITPYESLAKELADTVSNNGVKNVIFVEEEIRSGGFGMLLCDKMTPKGYLKDKNVRIMAADDPFVICQKGQSYLEASGLDSVSIAKVIAKMNQ
ncbi:MAG: 1-deoxy-D-xylulose-5-phosphate synthase, partial [Clostridia bacterium]|nr:1-deoxy-D-xylulose-5-phosphate synthase [Clostridia bacterium]